MVTPRPRFITGISTAVDLQPCHVTTSRYQTLLVCSASQVAAAYGVRPTFAALAFLQWAARPTRLTPTADCLSMLAQELRPLKRAEPNLLPEVRPSLFAVSVSVFRWRLKHLM